MLGNLLSRARLPALQSRQSTRSFGYNRNVINQLLRSGGSHVETPSTYGSAPSLPFTPSTSALPAPLAPQRGSLSNGLRVVVSENFAPVSGLGVFVDVGSRWEDSGNNGICHFLERMSMKSTKFTTTAALVRSVSTRGANVSASASRDSIFFSAECLRQDSDALLNVLRDISLFPELNDWELEDMVQEYSAQLKEKEHNPEAEIMDAIHAAAYGHHGLGLPVTAPASHLASFTPDVLRKFLLEHFTADRIVVSAVGVDPTKFLASAESLFGGLKGRGDNKLSRPASPYVGGDIRSHYKGENGLAHLALAFETANWHEADMVPMAVLQMMLGGGASFSAGGPGKGMYSRLYEQVLNRHHFVQSALSFNSIYDDTAIFGIYASADPGHAHDLAHVVLDQALLMANAPTAVEVTRAKNQLKSSVFMHLESRTMMVEDIGRQMLVYGQVHTPQQLAQRIDAVTPGDIQRVARNMLKTQPSVAAVGDISSVPRYDVLAEYLKTHAPKA